CYLVVLLVGVMAPRRWRPAVVVLLVGAAAGEALGRLLGLPTAVVSFPRLLDVFASGLAIYAFRDVLPFGRVRVAVACTLLALTFFLGGFLIAFPLVGGYALIACAITRRIPLQRFGRFGDFSYGLYVFAYPIQQALVRVLGTRIPVMGLFGLALA